MIIKAYASGSTGNLYTISDGETRLLIECGIPMEYIKKSLNFKLSDIDGCLVSHEHKDHSKSIKKIAACGINIYTSRGTAIACESTGHRTKFIKEGKQFSIKTFDIVPFGIKHDAKEPLGFLIYSKITTEKLVYLTDTAYCKHKFKDLAYIMVEMNYDDDLILLNVENKDIYPGYARRVFSTHMSKKTSLEFLRANWSPYLREVYLLHLSDRNADGDNFKKEAQMLTGAKVVIA